MSNNQGPGNDNPIERLIVEIAANIEPLIDGVKEGVAKAKDLLDGVGEAARKLGDDAKSAGDAIKTNISNGINQAQSVLSNFISMAKTAASAASSIGGSFVSGFGASMAPITGAISGIRSALSGLGGAAGGGGGLGSIASAMGAAASAGAALGTSLITLGGVAVSAIGVGIGAIAKGAIDGLKDSMAEATDVAQAYQRSFFLLEIAVRAAQREQGNSIGTIQEWEDSVKKLSEAFGVFSQRDIAQAVAQTALLTREFGFTKEQMDQVTQATLILAEANSMNASDVQIRVIQGLIGYRRSLAGLGVELDNLLVDQTAQELGLKKTVDQMDSSERAAVRLAAIMKQVAPLAADAAKAQDTLSGRTQKVAAEMDNAKAAIGDHFAPALITLNEIGAKVFGAIATYIDEVAKAIQIMAMAFTYLTSTMIHTGELVMAISKDMSILTDEQKKNAAITQFNTQVYNDMHGAFSMFGNLLGNIIPKLSDTTQEFFSLTGTLREWMDTVNDAAEKGLGQIADTFEGFHEQMSAVLSEEAAALEQGGTVDQDLWDKLNKIDADALDQRNRTLEDFADRRKKILRDIANLEDKNSDDAKKLQDDIAKATEDYNIKESRAAEDFETKRKREREDFLTEMHRLELKFNEDMIGAISNRDATQVLKLRRQFEAEKLAKTEDYNKKTEREQEDYDKQRARDKEDFDRRIAEMREQTRKTREQRLKDLQQQLKDLDDEQAKELRRQEETAAKQRIQAQKDSEKERKRLADEFQKRLDQINEQVEKELIKDAKKWADEGNLDEAGVRAILSIYEKMYGPIGGQGAIDRIVKAFLDRQRAISDVTIQIKVLTHPDDILPKNPDVGPNAGNSDTGQPGPTKHPIPPPGPTLASSILDSLSPSTLNQLGITSSNTNTQLIEIKFGGKVPEGMSAQVADRMIREITAAVKAVTPREVR